MIDRSVSRAAINQHPLGPVVERPRLGVGAEYSRHTYIRTSYTLPYIHTTQVHARREKRQWGSLYAGTCLSCNQFVVVRALRSRTWAADRGSGSRRNG
eukprot:46892-Eustigmatos_ZCMA.PRE.1